MAERGRGAEFVMLRLGGLRILLSQDEVSSLEPADDADMSSPHPGAVNDYQGHPVFALSEGLDGFQMERTGRPICALLDMPDGNYYGVLCSEAALLPVSVSDIKPVPPVMHEEDSALLGIVLDEKGLLCLTSAVGLHQLIMGLGGFWDDASEAA